MKAGCLPEKGSGPESPDNKCCLDPYETVVEYKPFDLSTMLAL